MIWLVALLLLAVGLFFSAFFSGAETGLYCMSRIRLQLGVHRNDLADVRLSRLLEDPTAAISSTLIGTNLMNYIATSATAFLLAEGLRLSDVDTELYTVLLLTPIVFVFGEVVPKSLFQQHPHRLLRKAQPLLSFSAFLFRMTGLIGLVGLLTRLVDRVTGAGHSAERKAPPKRRMAALLLEGLTDHTFADDQSQLIGRICGLSETAVHAVMVPRNRVFAIVAKTQRQELMRIARRTTFSRLPVFETRRTHIIGYVDVVRLLREDDWHVVGDRVEPITSVSPHQSVASATAQLQRDRQRIATVTDSSGLMLGIVTLRDLTDEVVGGLAEPD